jgi:hypothetical protein
MNRIGEIEIAGSTYPLNFSTKAAKEIAIRYDGLENIEGAFSGKAVDAMMDEIVWLLSLLIAQGVAYKRIVAGEEVKGITAEELEVVLGVADMAGLKDKIMDAMMGGMKREVEVEVDPKNAEATQSE